MACGSTQARCAIPKSFTRTARQRNRERSRLMGVRRSESGRLTAWMANNLKLNIKSEKEKQQEELEDQMAKTQTGLTALAERAAQRKAASEAGDASTVAPPTGEGVDEEALAQEEAKDQQNVMAVADAFSVVSFRTLTTERNDDSWGTDYQTKVGFTPHMWLAGSCSLVTKTRVPQPHFRGKLKYHKGPVTALALAMPIMVSADVFGRMVRVY